MVEGIESTLPFGHSAYVSTLVIHQAVNKCELLSGLTNQRKISIHWEVIQGLHAVSLDQPEEKVECCLLRSEHFWITSFRWYCILAWANDILNSLQKLCMNICLILIILSLVLVCPENADFTRTWISTLCLAISITDEFRISCWVKNQGKGHLKWFGLQTEKSFKYWLVTESFYTDRDKSNCFSETAFLSVIH